MLTNPEWPDLIAIEPEEIELFITLFQNAQRSKWNEQLPMKMRQKYARMYEQILTHASTLKKEN